MYHLTNYISPTAIVHANLKRVTNAATTSSSATFQAASKAFTTFTSISNAVSRAAPVENVNVNTILKKTNRHHNNHKFQIYSKYITNSFIDILQYYSNFFTQPEQQRAPQPRGPSTQERQHQRPQRPKLSAMAASSLSLTHPISTTLRLIEPRARAAICMVPPSIRSYQTSQARKSPCTYRT